VHPGIFITLLPIPPPGLLPSPVSHFTPSSSSRTHFPQQLLLAPPRALLGLLPPTATPAGAVRVWTTPAMPVLSPRCGGLGEPSLGVRLAGLNREAGCWAGITLGDGRDRRGERGSWRWCGRGVMLRSVLARGCEAQCWPAQKCLCRGQGLSFPLPPPRSRPAALGPKPSPPALAVGPGPPARGRTLVLWRGDVAPRARFGQEPAGHFSSSQPGSRGDFCSVIFYSEMIVTLFFFFLFISILVKAGDVLY